MKKLFYYCDCLDVNKKVGFKLSRVHKSNGFGPMQKTEVDRHENCVYCGYAAQAFTYDADSRARCRGWDTKYDEPDYKKKFQNELTEYALHVTVYEQKAEYDDGE